MLKILHMAFFPINNSSDSAKYEVWGGLLKKSGLKAPLNNFCSSEGHSSILGKEMPELGGFPTCDQFEITIMDGQPCYSLDVSKKVKDPTKLGKNNGLLLLLDPFPYQLMESKMDGQSFKVYIHTVSQFTAYGPGTYSMTVLKKTTGTKKFLQLPDDRKKCSDHKREECQTQAYLDQIQRECKCVPWALKIPTRQVTFSIFESIPSL